MKKSRQDYKRRWIAVRRNWKKSFRDACPVDSDSDDGDVNEPELSTVEDNMQSVLTAAIDNVSPRQSNCEDECRSDLDDQRNLSDDGWDAIDHHVHAPVLSSSESESETSESFEKNLVAWISEYNVKHNAVDGLLKLLKTSGHPDLPSTARTLLHTAKQVETQVKSGMEYYYFGMASEILKHFKQCVLQKRDQVNGIELSLNIDGLPLFRSSSVSLWPVLCGIVNIRPTVVFPVALTCGASKPSDLEFLSDVIRDLKMLLQQGLQDGDKSIPVSIRCIVCDAPAKAMVKMVKLYSGYFGCDKCSQHGEWYGRMTYQDAQNLNLRTDYTFRQQLNEEHHTGESPLCQLPIDMVRSFPIDYMHQVCLGCMKRLLLIWIRGLGKRNIKVKHSAAQINQISCKLEALKNFIPNAFVRKPRSLKEIDRWKASEYRQFLLYTGKLALCGILRDDLYEHFMQLSIALSILVSPHLVQNHVDYARQLLACFVTRGRKLYGREFLVYNIHSLLHLADEAEFYGSLDACAAWPFENYMHTLKKLVRSGRQPMTQIVKRLSERTPQLESRLNTVSKVSTKPPNNAFVQADHTCVEVLHAAVRTRDQEEAFVCRVYDDAEPLFTEPCDSRIIRVYRVHRRNTYISEIPKDLLTQRAIKIEDTGRTIFMGLLHELHGTNQFYNIA